MDCQKWTARDFLDDLWHDLAGQEYRKPKKQEIPSLEALRESEWCGEFEELCRNRLVMGAFRYGLMKDQDYNKYNLVREIKERLSLYEESSNLEHIVDAANICMLQFVKGSRNGEEMRPVDDGRHTPEIKGGGVK